MRTEKHFSPSPTEILSAMITCLATQGAICCYHKADYLTSTAGCVCSFAIFFSQMPTLLFVEMLPSWHRQKYICVCVDVCVWVSVCGSARLRVCVFCGWVGVYVEWKAVRMEEWMTQTGQSGGRLVSGPYSHYQAGCSIWQLTESLQAPSLHRPTKRSALQSAPLSGCFSFSLTAAKPQSAPLIHT